MDTEVKAELAPLDVRLRPVVSRKPAHAEFLDQNEVARLSPAPQAFLTRAELSLRTGLSLSTIDRLKRDGRIRYCQPGGKGARVLFPVDAIEPAGEAAIEDPSTKSLQASTPAEPGQPKRLPGPRPRWRN